MKSSKAKYSNLQQIINTNFNDFQKSINDLYDLTLNLLDGIHEDSLSKEKRLENLILKTLENSLISTLKNSTTATSPVNNNHTLTSTKKLVIIPKHDSSADDVTKCLRSKAREMKDFPKLSSLKRTKNNNLEIKSLPSNLEKQLRSSNLQT